MRGLVKDGELEHGIRPGTSQTWIRDSPPVLVDIMGLFGNENAGL